MLGPPVIVISPLDVCVHVPPVVEVHVVPTIVVKLVSGFTVIEVFALISILSPDLIDMIPEVVTAFILDLVVSIMSFPLLNRVSDSE